MPDFKGHWSFCLLGGTADINYSDGRLRVLGTAVLLEELQSVFLQHGAIWHETQGQCFFERENYSELCQNPALPELSLSSMRLNLELHEMLMQEGGCHYVCQSLCLRQAWAAGEIC